MNFWFRNIPLSASCMMGAVENHISCPTQVVCIVTKAEAVNKRLIKLYTGIALTIIDAK